VKVQVGATGSGQNPNVDLVNTTTKFGFNKTGQILKQISSSTFQDICSMGPLL
jgi:hypothetical protein